MVFTLSARIMEVEHELWLKGNCYWKDRICTSMIMGGRVFLFGETFFFTQGDVWKKNMEIVMDLFMLTAGLTTPWPNCNFCGWGGVGWG